jgi:hypothetical protein
VYKYHADPSDRVHPLVMPSGLSSNSFVRGDERDTIDPDGAVVDPEEARFDRATLLAAVPASYTDIYGGSGFLFNSGVNHNGTTPLMVYLDGSSAGPGSPPSAGKLIVFHGGTINPSDPLNSSNATVTDANLRRAGPLSTEAGHGEDFLDILNNTVAVDALGFQPWSMVVMHGLILAAGTVWKCTSVGTQWWLSLYEFQGWGFASNQDAGAGGWSLLWSEKTATAIGAHEQDIEPRGAPYCLRVAPHGPGRTTQPLFCGFVSSGYIFKNDSSEMYQARSGRAYYFQATRANTSQEWEVVGGTNGLVHAINVWPGEEGIEGILNHVHSVMATEWNTGGDGPGGVQLMISIGDGPTKNRFICARLDDYTADYTIPENWTIIDNYHGVAEETATPTAPISTASPQPVAASFGAEPGQIVWGSDLGTEWLFMANLPTATGGPDQAQFDHMYGASSSFGHDAANAAPRRPGVVFSLSQPHPELSAGPMVAVYTEITSLAGGEAQATRVLYCPDGTKPDEWAQVAAIHGTDISNAAAALYGDYVYFAGFSYSLKRIPLPSVEAELPTLVRMHPLLIGCGGVNLVHEDYLIVPEDATAFTNLDKNTSAPFWTDGRTLPNPPSMATQAIKIKTQLDNGDGWAGQVRVSSNAGGSSWGSGWATNITQVRRIRGWLLDGSYDRSRPIPNKSKQFMVRVWDGSSTTNGVSAVVSCSNRWTPVTYIIAANISSSGGVGLRFYPTDQGTDTGKDENYGYFIVDLALDGNGDIPYPSRRVRAAPMNY